VQEDSISCVTHFASNQIARSIGPEIPYTLTDNFKVNNLIYEIPFNDQPGLRVWNADSCSEESNIFSQIVLATNSRVLMHFKDQRSMRAIKCECIKIVLVARRNIESL
jgi:hypothetical protein